MAAGVECVGFTTGGSSTVGGTDDDTLPPSA